VKTCIIIHTLISFVEEGDEDNEFMEELVREGRDAPDDVIVGHADTGRDQSDSQQEAQGQRKCEYFTLPHTFHAEPRGFRVEW
jgi:hypothetical protein